MDVAIVGGGPSGAWTARALAERGARVTIFDPSHPREKPCGGGVTGRALALVADAIDPRGLHGVVVNEARFAGAIADSSRPDDVSVALPAHGVSSRSALVVVSRALFDRALLDAAVRAGANLVTARVRDVRVDAGGAHLQIDDRQPADRPSADRWLRADVVVGADGANSLVRRRVSRALDRSELSIAAGFFVRQETGTHIDIAFSTEPAGYFWSFPRHDHLAVGTCAQADGCSADDMRSLTMAWLRGAGLADPSRLERYAWPIPSLPTALSDSGALAGDRWLLVGDAAGLVDPITREGIYFALRSAALAADALCAGPGTAARYRAALAEEIEPELAHAARLKAGFFRRRFIDLAMDGMAHSERIQHVMADLVAGMQPYRSLRGRLLRTFEMGLAWKLLRSRYLAQ